jgi:hypothetical protein
MVKKLWKQDWTVSSPGMETYVNVEDDKTPLTEHSAFGGYIGGLNIPEEEVISDQAEAVPFEEPEEITELTDEEAKVIEDALNEKPISHNIGVLENIMDDPRLSRIKEKLKATI